MIDIHTHILPSMDDGCRDIETSIALARMAQADGVTIVTATPHVMKGFFDNSREDILDRTAELNTALEQEQIMLQIRPGAEYYLDTDLPERLARDELMTLNDGKCYLLVELPETFIPAYTEKVLYEIQLQGITPVIAHPERNLEFRHNPSLLQDLVERGTLAQITSGSVTGLFGRRIKKTALDFIQAGLGQVVASDAHSLKSRTPRLSPAAAEIERLWGRDLALTLMEENPGKILSGEIIEPVPAPTQVSWWKRLGV